MEFNVPHIHVGLIGLPGHGKDLFTQGFFIFNNQVFKENGVRPFSKIVRLSLVDRAREMVSWITNENLRDYLVHPNKDEQVCYQEQNLEISRRDFLTKFIGFAEKYIDKEWLKNSSERDIHKYLREIVTSISWSVESDKEELQSNIQKALDVRPPELFITPDVRQEHQYDWIKNKSNGFLIRITDSSLPKKNKYNKIEKMLTKKEVDLEIERSMFGNFVDIDGKKEAIYNHETYRVISLAILSKLKKE